MQEFDKAINEIFEKYYSKVLREIYAKKDNKEIVIFGSGEMGHKVFNVLQIEGIQVQCFCDNLQKGKIDKRTGLKIVGVDELVKKKENLLILIAVFEDQVFYAIYQMLIENGFKESQLLCVREIAEILPLSHMKKNIDNYRKVYSFLEEGFSRQVYLKRIQRSYLELDLTSVVSNPREEYFDKQIALTEEEVFVDCGGFDGDTAIKFIDETNGKYKNIIIFEPELSKQELIRKRLNKYRYNLYQYGAWSSNTILKFNDRGDVASCISENGKVEIKVLALDDVIYTEKPTFIKMDIEGSEVEALKGCKKIITEFKPKLAICIYHKPEDLFEIPLLIKEMRDDYEIFIRQYDNSRYETVCYAI